MSSNEALVRRAIEEIWNRGELDVADELFAADYMNHYGLIVDLVLGPEAIKISAALYRVAFPGLYVTVEEVSSMEDTVMLRWTATAPFDKLVSGDPPWATRSLKGRTRCRIVDGMIIETWTEWDRLGTLDDLDLRILP